MSSHSIEPKHGPIRSPRRELLREIGKTLFAISLVVGFIALLRHAPEFATQVPEMTQFEREAAKKSTAINCGPVSERGRPIVISMLYGYTKTWWIEHAADRFAYQCPNVQLKLQAMDDIESANAILRNEARPTLWSPSDDIVVDYFNAQASPPVDTSSLQSLVRSPLVMLVWQDRYRVMEAIWQRSRDEGIVAQTLCALVPQNPDITNMAQEDMVPGRWQDWFQLHYPPDTKPLRTPTPPRNKAKLPEPRLPIPTIEEISRWGRVKIRHTSPTHSLSGLEAIYLMAYDHAFVHNKTWVVPEGSDAAPVSESLDAGVDAAEAFIHATVSEETDRKAFDAAFMENEKAFGQWLRRCEGGLEPLQGSAKSLAMSMFQKGPSHFDGVISHENIAIMVLAWLQHSERAIGVMHLAYIDPTIIHNHPVVIFDDRKEQKEAALAWIEFLRSEEMQNKAIELGFRPADDRVDIRNNPVAKNPFVELRRYGLMLDPPLQEVPRLNGERIRRLIEIWQDATKQE